MSTTLIKGGTVVTASGTLDADVLIAGEKIAAVLARDGDRGGRRGRGGGSRGPGHRRDGQVRAARRDRRAHAHGDAVRRHVLRGHLRDRHPRRGVGRHHHDHRLRGPGQGHLAAGHAGQMARQGGRQLRDRLRLPHDRLRRQRHDAEGNGRLHRGRGEQLQDVHGLPRRVLRDRRRDPARHAAGGPLRRDRDDARGERHRHRPAGRAGARGRPHGPGRARPDQAARAGGRGHVAGHHAGQGGELPAVHRAPVRPARARGGGRRPATPGRTCSPRPARSTCGCPSTTWPGRTSRGPSSSPRRRCGPRTTRTRCGRACGPTTCRWCPPTTARSASRTRRNSAGATSPRSPTGCRASSTGWTCCTPGWQPGSSA